MACATCWHTIAVTTSSALLALLENCTRMDRRAAAGAGAGRHRLSLITVTHFPPQFEVFHLRPVKLASRVLMTTFRTG
ncbi:hypothetical protein SPHV1_690015 [Novosphingobium sp. KN65.2]|nr:hypothetical protein SPHV1_690015 [Novosphingobium sp. KN65.2]